MLSKKQYVVTLLASVAIFLVAFIIGYFYMLQNSWITNKEEIYVERAVIPVEETLKQEICVLPQTVIILKSKDSHGKLISETKVSAKSLLGMTYDEVALQFEDYQIETFNEDKVTLVKSIPALPSPHESSKIYVLGIEDEYLCIREKGSNKRPVKINYEASHFSKYIYSLLLNEEIEITSKQREALLLNASGVQKILQGYVGE